MRPGVEALEEDDTAMLGTCKTKSGGMRGMLLSTMYDGRVRSDRRGKKCFKESLLTLLLILLILLILC
jgi:hypothetical protein